MTTKHTPGPWSSGESRDGRIRIWPEGSAYVLAECPPRCEMVEQGGLTEDRANAALMAAAPDLLAACKSAMRAMNDNLQPGPMDDDAKAALYAAIAKAEGR